MPNIAVIGQATITDLNDSKQYLLYLSGNYKTQIYDPNQNKYTPDFTSTNLVITPQLYVAGGNGTNLLPSANTKSIKWFEGADTSGTPLAESASGTTPAGLSYAIPTGSLASTSKTLTLKSNLSNANAEIYTCQVVYTDPSTLFDITILANFEVVKVVNGVAGADGYDAITVVLTNDNVTIPTDSDGANGVYTNSGTDIHVYEGNTELNYDGVGTSNGTYKVTAVATGVTAGSITDTGVYATLGSASAISADSASIVLTITGKRSDGTPFTQTSTQTLTRIKEATNGTSPTAYWLVSSVSAINKSASGVYTPNSITASGMSQVGNGTPVPYSTYFRFSESTDGTNFTVKQTSSANATSASYSFSTSGLKAIKVEMFLAGGTTTLVDTQTIPVISDGAAGSDSYFLNVWAPSGDTIRNSSSDIVLEADLYKGSGQITPTAYKWYVQDPTATTSSGGDTDGGNGWRLINSVAAPTTAPTLALVSDSSSKLTAGTYYAKYTWCGLSGETVGSPETSLAVTAGKDLKITVPSFPTNAVMAKVYVGTATGAEKYVGDITTTGGSLTISQIDPNAIAIPTINTATNVTSAQLTVKPWAIPGVEGFKCVATAPTTGTKYTGVIVVKDFQDPITVNIIGTNVFKNGQGSTTLQAQLVQAGAVIPTTGYTFAWALYNSDGSLAKTYTGVTGDTITIPAGDVTGTGNLVVDVSK